MKNKLVILLAFLIIPALSFARQTGKYSAAGIDNDAAVETFFLDMQKAVSKDDRAIVASMINYPVKVYGEGRTTVISKESDLLKKYDSVFTPQVKKVLAKQTISDLFVNGQGVMVGNGEIWFNQLANGNNIRIITINN